MIADGLHDVPAGKVAMIVTHLEMHARPETADLTAPDGISFRPVTPTVAWYRDVFDRVGSDWLWYGRRQMEDEALSAVISDADVEVYTLTKDGRDEALLELDFRVPGECELAYFGVTSRLIGTGAGRYLMNQAIDIAWGKAISRFHVHTCTIDSPQALGFYIRSGFTPYKQQVEIDDDPRLRGLLAETKGPHVPLLRP